jgi:hypothetical protein
MILRRYANRVPIVETATRLSFGKYRGASIADVLAEDPQYLVWAQENVGGFDLHHSLLEIAESDAERTRWELMSGFEWRLKENGT